MHSEHLELGAVVIVMMIVSMVVTARMTGTPALSFVVPVVARALQATVGSQRRVLIVDVDGHDARRGARAPELIIKHGLETRRCVRLDLSIMAVPIDSRWTGADGRSHI